MCTAVWSASRMTVTITLSIYPLLSLLSVTVLAPHGLVVAFEVFLQLTLTS